MYRITPNPQLQLLLHTYSLPPINNLGFGYIADTKCFYSTQAQLILLLTYSTKKKVLGITAIILA
jgi:hypothetical protein